MKDKNLEINKLKKELHELHKYNDLLNSSNNELKTEIEELSKFKAISDKAGHGIAMRDLKGKFIYVNEAFAAMHGYDVSDFKGRNFSSIHTRQQLQLITKLRSTQTEGYIAEIGHKKKDGTIFPALMTGSVIKDEKGKPLYLSATAIDITDLKKTEEALRKQTARNELVLQTAMDGFYLTDAEGKILDLNQSASMIMGYSASEIVGANISDFELDETQSETIKSFQEAMKKGAYRYEVLHRHKDGHIMSLEFTTTYILMGKEKYFFSFFRDITDRKQIEMELCEREKQLETNNLNLKDINIALRVLLKQRGDDQKKLDAKTLKNIEEQVKPYLKKLKQSKLEKEQAEFVTILESALDNIISPFSIILTSNKINLSHIEIYVASLIKEGKTTKHIAGFMNLSPRTVEFHRRNIRKKSGIKNKNINLRSYLRSLESDETTIGK